MEPTIAVTRATDVGQPRLAEFEAEHKLALMCAIRSCWLLDLGPGLASSRNDLATMRLCSGMTSCFAPVCPHPRS